MELKFPELKIRVELNGTKMALVQSYNASAQWESRPVEAFGEGEPVATLRAGVRYRVELNRLLLCGGEQKPDSLYGLDNFRLAIVRPDRKIIYTGCCWESISEQADGREAVTERAVLTATGRVEERSGN